AFASPGANGELVRAVGALRALNAAGLRKVPSDAPVGFVPGRWASAVIGESGVDRHGWEMSLLAEVRNALRAGDLTVEGSRRYAPWDGELYAKDRWAQRRGSWFSEGGLPASGQAYVDVATKELHDLTAGVAQRLPANADARIEKGKLAVTPLGKIEVPAFAEQARARLVGLLPWVSLPELLMEVDRWEGCEFTRALLHLTGRRQPTTAHVAAIRPALFAVLVAEATNIGLATMAHACGIPEGQLRRVYDWYFHEDALRQATTLVIGYHGTLPLTARLGSGHTSSSDGIRFGVASSALNARHLPRYFGMRRGLTLYSHVLDQGTQYWVDMVNCQLREATFVLDGLLYQDAPAVTEHYTDTHGATELLFGLFALLGFRFSPRLADLGDQVLYRGTKGAHYGALDPVIRQSVRTALIVEQWDDLNRLAASLRDGLARPSLVVTRLQAMRRQNRLQQAIAELGRIEKTRHILTIADDPAARRRMLVGLNKQERLHSMAREVTFGRQGRYGDRGYEAQLARASCLSLVLNAMIVWTTRYLWAAADELARRGQPVPEEAWRYLSAIMWEHVQLVGDYSFDEHPPVDGLRPLQVQEA
ncbi:MAG: Tn3 family transposase, partial [Acidimicrobiales bacterium]